MALLLQLYDCVTQLYTFSSNTLNKHKSSDKAKVKASKMRQSGTQEQNFAFSFIFPSLLGLGLCDTVLALDVQCPRFNLEQHTCAQVLTDHLQP